MSEKIAVICIGDELLKGAVVNTNLSSIGVRLLALGVQGKEIGRILNLALKLVVEDPDMNEHDSLVAFAKHEIEKSRS